MQDDLIIYGAYALVYVVVAGLLLFAGTKTVEQFKAFIPALVPPLRRFFDDPKSLQVKLLEEKLRIKRELADAMAEALANAMESLIRQQPAPNLAVENLVKTQNELVDSVVQLVKYNVQQPVPPPQEVNIARREALPRGEQ